MKIKTSTEGLTFLEVKLEAHKKREINVGVVDDEVIDEGAYALFSVFVDFIGFS